MKPYFLFIPSGDAWKTHSGCIQAHKSDYGDFHFVLTRRSNSTATPPKRDKKVFLLSFSIPFSLSLSSRYQNEPRCQILRTRPQNRRTLLQQEGQESRSPVQRETRTDHRLRRRIHQAPSTPKQTWPTSTAMPSTT